MNKLFFVDPSIKIDSFLSMFEYAIYQLAHNNISLNYLDDLFDYFISQIEDKNINPLELNQQLDDAYFLTRSQHRNDQAVITILSYLMAKSHQYLEKQLSAILKQK